MATHGLSEAWELNAVSSEAATASGMVETAVSNLRSAIAHLEDERPFHPGLVVLLELLIQALPASGAALAEEARARADYLRGVITGRSELGPCWPTAQLQNGARLLAQTKERARLRAAGLPIPEVPRVAQWPNRVPPGIFKLSPIKLQQLEPMVKSASLRTPNFPRAHLIDLQGKNEVIVVIDDWESRPTPERLERNRRFSTQLEDLWKASKSSPSGSLRFEEWWLVEDTLATPWWQWTGEELSRVRTRIASAFPTAATTVAGGIQVGRGIVREPGDRGVRQAEPSLNIQFVTGKGICFRGVGSAFTLDTRFMAFAKATGLFPPRLYTPFQINYPWQSFGFWPPLPT